jgi:uncharacterized protein (UPF0335 family)
MSDDVVSRILATVERLESGQEQLRADLLARVERLEGELVQTRADLMARMDRLQDVLTAEHEGEIVTLGVAERAERIAKAAQDEVRLMGEQLNAMIRQIRRLQSDVETLRGGL